MMRDLGRCPAVRRERGIGTERLGKPGVPATALARQQAGLHRFADQRMPERIPVIAGNQHTRRCAARP
jgi:hypothetical protein